MHICTIKTLGFHISWVEFCIFVKGNNPVPFPIHPGICNHPFNQTRNRACQLRTRDGRATGLGADDAVVILDVNAGLYLYIHAASIPVSVPLLVE